MSCDFNATDASQEEDVFTLARDKGAVAAVSLLALAFNVLKLMALQLLYSLYSKACIINPEYADPASFDQVFDIFSTQSRTSANIIESQFNEPSMNKTMYGAYDSQRLNDSAHDIALATESGYLAAPGFMFAVLEAYNATVTPVSGPPETTGGVGAASAGNGNSPNTALAM